MNGRAGRESRVPHYLYQRHIAHGASRASQRGKDQVRFVAKRANALQHRQRRVAERDSMLDPGFHARAGNAPVSRFEMDLVPLRKSRLARAARRQHHEPQASLCRRRNPRGFDGVERGRDISVGQGAEVRLDGRHCGQRTVNGFSRDVLGYKPMRLGPAQDRADPLPDTPSRFRPSPPYRRQDGQHVGTLNAVDAQAAEGRKGVALERLHPRVSVLVIPPARPERRVSTAGGHCETRNRGPSLFGNRVASRRYSRAIIHGLLARSRKADIRISSETDIVALAVDGDSLDPALGSALGNGQVERSAVSVQPLFCEGFDFAAVSFPTFTQRSSLDYTGIEQNMQTLGRLAVSL